MNTTQAVNTFVRSILLAVSIALTPVISATALSSLGLTVTPLGGVFAAETEPKAYKTKKSYSLRQSVFKQFSTVQKSTDAGDWAGALDALQSIEGKSQKYTSFEKANLWNYYAWVYYSLENYSQSISYYQKVLAESELNDALQSGTLYTLAQLLMVQEDYRGAVKYLEQWMALQSIIGSEPYALLAQNHYQLNDMAAALKNINIAVDQSERKGQIPAENWYVIQRAIYFERGDNETVIAILQKLIRHYSKPNYWKQLSSMYGQVGEEGHQLHSLEVAYLMGALVKEHELLNLAYLFLSADVPYKAALVIDQGMKAKQIPETSKNLEVLATAWRLSQEINKSIPEMEKAAEKASSGDLYARLAAIYLDGDRFHKAIESGLKAVKRGGVKRMDQLHIIVGMAHTNLEQYDDAVRAFNQAATDKRSQTLAAHWIQFAQGERQRKRQLNL